MLACKEVDGARSRFDPRNISLKQHAGLAVICALNGHLLCGLLRSLVLPVLVQEAKLMEASM